MRRFVLLSIILGATCLCCGCGMVRDMMFDAFSDSYTGGGYTREDRQRDYHREISRWEGGPRYYDPVCDR